MTFTDAINSLSSLSIKKGINYDLTRLQGILSSLGNPQNELTPVIHIAGTNGKGSTVAFLQHILQENKHTVGTFTSPHLSCYTERIAYNNTPIPAADFVMLFQTIQPYFEAGLTEFEGLTLMAILYFHTIRPDYCIVETGLGGRLDATNCLTPSCCAITSIGFDHQAILGDNLALIAAEKAGIIKPERPVFTPNSQAPEALAMITRVAKKNHCNLTYCAPTNRTIPLGLAGDHQCINAGLAAAVATYISPGILQHTLHKGLAHTSHWGRLTSIKDASQTTRILIDAAHNSDGIASLSDYLRTTFPTRNLCFLIGISTRKPIEPFASELQQWQAPIYYCTFSTTLARPLADCQPQFTTPLQPYTLGEALPPADLLVITGSLYFIGAFHKHHSTLLSKALP